MRTAKEIKTLIMSLVTGATSQRMRPYALEQTVVKKSGASMAEVKLALTDLIREKKLTYSYRDPCSYVEVPTLEGQRSA